MKKQILTLILIICSVGVNAQFKNLDKLPKSKRDSVLLEISKKTIMKYGPEFYEIYQPPLIERKVVPVEYENAGRVKFCVTYLYDKEFYKKYPDSPGSSLVEVYIWEDTGLACSVSFAGQGLSDLDKIPKTRNSNEKRMTHIFKRYPKWEMITVVDTTKYE